MMIYTRESKTQKIKKMLIIKVLEKNKLFSIFIEVFKYGKNYSLNGKLFILLLNPNYFFHDLVIKSANLIKINNTEI